MGAGRRGRKRKAEAPLEEEQVEQQQQQQPSAVPAAEGAGPARGSQGGPRVVIEHWQVCHDSSRITQHKSFDNIDALGYRVDSTNNLVVPRKPIAFHVCSGVVLAH